MNWEAVGAISQIVGAVLVGITLIYLAIQLRQNTSALKSSTFLAISTLMGSTMGSRTYETALNFEAKGFGWAYGEKPTFVLTSRDLPRTRDTVEFYSGDLVQFVNERLRPTFRSIWFVGGGVVSGECLRLGLADEVRYSILPILIGDGIRFFEKLDTDVPLHLAEVKAYKSSTVGLRYEVQKPRPNA